MKTQSTMGIRGTMPPSTTGASLLIMSNGFFASLPLLPGAEMVIGRSTSCDVHLDDPMASRRHARLFLGESVVVEDLGSANGTRVRDALLPPHTLTSIAPGEIISIGSTLLVMQQTRHSNGARRAWSHGYFERRLHDECLQAERRGGRFALVRLHVENAAPWTRVVPVLARELPPPQLFAAYGPQDFELLLEAEGPDVERTIERIRGELAGADAPARFGVAWYPRDGRTADALLARANGAVRLSGGEPLGPTVELASEAMKRAYDMAVRAAPTNISVLLLGETGVGKEVMTRAIHAMSARAGKPFLALNCAGLSEGIIESELFGHEEGSYTGATGAKIGLLEAANGGTLFFDELGEMPLTIQAKLLRVLETREVLPVGGRKARPIDVRIVAATNRDLDAEAERGTFRRDLFYRLNGISITIPPLRERRSEIEPLARLFIERAAEACGRAQVPRLTADASAALMAYDWPGNLRELRNIMERAVLLCDGAEIGIAHLPEEKLKDLVSSPGNRVTPPSMGARSLTPDERSERARMIAALDHNGWNQSRAAEELGMPRRTFISKLARYDIPRPNRVARRPTPDEGDA